MNPEKDVSYRVDFEPRKNYRISSRGGKGSGGIRKAERFLLFETKRTVQTTKEEKGSPDPRGGLLIFLYDHASGWLGRKSEG